MEDCQIPALKNESGNAASIIESLQAQLDQAHEELQTVKEEAAQSAAISAQNIESLLADNLLLKGRDGRKLQPVTAVNVSPHTYTKL